MRPEDYDMETDIAWCPGCGNFSILRALKMALAELEIPPERLVLVSGIGQAGKLPQYMRCNHFNGLHGRSLPAAVAIKAVNPELTVIDVSGDGCMYGEGGNHFIHNIRRNPDITTIVHDNMVYGLTKGQASPTSQPGFKTPVQVHGVFEEPFNPIAVAVALGATFVARAFSGDVERTRDILVEAISHHGYALVDIFQPCVTFNRVNTFQWFREHTYYTEHDPEDRLLAFEKSLEGYGGGKFPLGVIYRVEGERTFEENLSIYREDSTPLWRRSHDPEKLKRLIESKRRV
ncbi:2-oxoacid ferredoxin oxidoreductase [Methanothermobacter thermautotrophicus]|jgi:2-oxoglutarate ferredoxin oxidoreductase subunit beta|uniref:2-oxoacid ferredoxin oxidoreductase n=1 Tax=Methanothermobacter thermautotrophicus TaxID=145262 RepID=A0A842YSA1_METTF|nr:thiamine pyrophosphate-dependent enzyme [Methanothermobacter thermautotrophicus]MBE2900783.1 2-oxoacid ferredoxin oxidoreductase [Methanothermobacter thermautotrophicus]MCQ8905460.1 thiamine pyrophosphate-dependent enzyme [Methanothermobacter sp.]